MVFSFTESNISLVLAANEVSFCNAEGLIMIKEGFSGLGEKATCVAVSDSGAFAPTLVFSLLSDLGATGNLVGASSDSLALGAMSVCVGLDSLLLTEDISLPDLAADLVRFVFRSSIGLFTIPIDR